MLTATRATLSDALQFASQIVERRNTIPILQAGWALTTLVDISDWQKRDQLSEIIGRLAKALIDVDTASEACPTCEGNGKEGRHSICRDCDENPPSAPSLAGEGLISKPSTQRIATFGKAEYAAHEEALRAKAIEFRAGEFDGDDLLTLQAVERALSTPATEGE